MNGGPSGQDPDRPVQDPSSEPEPEPQSPADSDSDSDSDSDRLAADRAALVALCLYAYDRARSAAVAERIEDGLAAVGICAVRPDGQAFDPRSHEAGGTRPTGDAMLDGTVAETEIAGFTDRGAVLRVPVVTVYRHEPPGSEPSGGDPSGGDPSGGDPSGGDPSGSQSRSRP